MKKVFGIPLIVIILLSACKPSDQSVPYANAPVVMASPFLPTGTATEILSTPTFTPIPTPTLVPETAFIKGITLNYSGNGPKLGTPGAQEMIDRYIISSRANYVALIPTCWSVNMRDTRITCSSKRLEGGVPPVSDKELVDTIHYLHSVGLRVILKPQALVQTVHIAETELKERHWDKTQRKEWFDNYIVFITRYAKLAEKYQVDLLVVGNEQEDNTQYEQEWRRVIAAVREVYHGPITYAANAWGFEASGIRFWDALDYIGTNGYQFGFVSKKDPTVDDMVESWQPYLQRLEEMSKEYGKQVIITEIGALSMQDYNLGWNSAPQWVARPYDGQAQADCYTAFFEALKDKPWLKGIIVWDMDTEPLQGGTYDLGYTFIGKPAEQVVHKYFGGEPVVTPAAPPESVEDPDNSRVVYDDELAHGWIPWFEPNVLVVPDLHSSNGHESSSSIRLPLSRYRGIAIDNGLASIDMSKYKWLEFYIMVGKRQPESLLVQFEYWTPGELYHSRRVLVNDPNYIEGGQYQPDTWQRVRIPLIDLGIRDQRFTGFGINNCSWPCALDRNVDDVYIDDIRLVAGKSNHAETPSTTTPAFVEDSDNSMILYEDGLESNWWMWKDEGSMTLSELDVSPGYQSPASIHIPLSKIGALTLVYDYTSLYMSKYKWIEFDIMVGENEPKNLVMRFEDWSPGAPTYFGAFADDPSYIEGGQYQPGTWQHVRIPLIDLGFTDQRIPYTAAFSLRNCLGSPCGTDSAADDIYIDNIRLVAGKSP